MNIQAARDLVEECFNLQGAIQNWDEAAEFAAFISERDVSNILELGTGSGGMMLLMDRACKPGLRISMDMPWDKRDPDVADREEGFRCHLPQTIEVLGNIHEREQWTKLYDYLEDRPLDLILQDSDHSAAGSMQDWNDYVRFLRSGGYFAFHDIRSGAEVGRTYDLLCKKYPHYEFVDMKAPLGIGVIQI